MFLPGFVQHVFNNFNTNHYVMLYMTILIRTISYMFTPHLRLGLLQEVGT